MDGGFTLIAGRGSAIEMVPYYEEHAYATREDAKRAALDSARRILSRGTKL
jgi:hypothetical protein